MQKKAIVYDRQGDAHYDVISAFIKSIRGSDPDAALFWLARMLEAGEDARFIARRLIVHASEDVGMADSHALLVAVAAAQAVEHVGLPGGAAEPRARHDLPGRGAEVEQRVPRASTRRWRTRRRRTPVPLHLRDASYPGAQRLGHGKGYRYPHDFPATSSIRNTGRRPSTVTAISSLRAWARTSNERRALHARRHPPSKLREPRIDHEPRGPVMTLLALSGGDTALIILAAFWGLLVLFLCVVLINTFRVLESTRMTIDAFRQETVPLLREVKTSVEKANREIDRVDTLLVSSNEILGRVEKVTALAQEAASSPLVKVISVGAGLRRGVGRADEGRP